MADSTSTFLVDAVHGWHESQDHSAWFLGEVAQALEEAADPAVERVPHDRVLSS